MRFKLPEVKRPFVIIGFAYFLTQAILVLCIPEVVLICTIILALSLASFFVLKKITKENWRNMIVLILCSALLSSAISLIYNYTKVVPSQRLNGQRAVITGKIADQPVFSNGRYLYIIDTEEIRLKNAPQNVKVRLSTRTPMDADINDYVTVDVQFNNFSADDWRVRIDRLSRGILATAYLSPSHQAAIRQGDRSIMSTISSLRDALASSINRAFPKDIASLLTAMLLGDKSALSDKVVSDFRISGLSHLLAVSGVHMSIIAMWLLWLLKRLRLGVRLASGLGCVGVLFLMALTGFSFSAARAGIMLIIMLAAQCAWRKADSLNSLGAALFLICVTSPFAAASISLTLSAAATLGLILFSPAVGRYVKQKIPLPQGKISRKITTYAIDALVVTLVASVCTMPLTMLYFGEVSVIAPLTNVLSMFAASAFLTLGGAAALVGLIPVIGPFLRVILSVIPFIMGKYILFTTSAFAGIPGASASASFAFTPYFLLGAVGMITIWRLRFAKSGSRARSLAVCLAVIMAVYFINQITYYSIHNNENTVIVYDVDDGLAVAVFSKGKCFVIGTGGDKYKGSQMIYDMTDKGVRRVSAVFYPEVNKADASFAADFIEKFHPVSIYAEGGGDLSDVLNHQMAASQIDLHNINGINYRIAKNDLKISAYIDRNGAKWICAWAGDLYVIICPPGGDCGALPPEMCQPDCAVVTTRDVANITALKPTAVVVSGSRENAAIISAQLGARGLGHVYATGLDGNITLKAERDGLRVAKSGR